MILEVLGWIEKSKVLCSWVLSVHVCKCHLTLTTPFTIAYQDAEVFSDMPALGSSGQPVGERPVLEALLQV